MERYDAVVIGAGPSGSAAALSIARTGLSVLVVERGKTPGSKNVFGGRIYSYPLFSLLPDWRKDCPVERFVTRDVLAFMTEDRSLLIQFESPRLISGHAASFTALRFRFDDWLARKAEAAGATLITGTRVDDLWLEHGRVRGIVAGGDYVGAEVVIAADGIVSKFTERMGLRGEMTPRMVSVGVKETVELSAGTIQDRFGVDEEQGAAWVMAGHASGGLRGGGFLYTNRDSVSLGLVVASEDLSRKKSEIGTLQEKFKRHPTVARLLKGGKVIEYSTHMIPELGASTLSRAYADGFLAVGDAAGFLINHGYTFRGVDLAIASGMAAGEAVKLAKAHGDFSAGSLASYEEALRQNRVLTDLETFRRGPKYLSNQRLFSEYPKLACDLADRIYTVDGTGKERLVGTVIEEIKKGRVSLLDLLRDLIGGVRSM